MDVGAVQSFVRTHHRAVLSTFRQDGQPQLSPVLVALDDAGRIVVSSREPAVKVRNLRRDPRAAVCVFTDQFFGNWVQAEGSATIVSLPDAMEPLVDYYRVTSGGEHPDWDEYRAAMRAESRCLIQIPIERVGPTISG